MARGQKKLRSTFSLQKQAALDNAAGKKGVESGGANDSRAKLPTDSEASALKVPPEMGTGECLCVGDQPEFDETVGSA